MSAESGAPASGAPDRAVRRPGPRRGGATRAIGITSRNGRYEWSGTVEARTISVGSRAGGRVQEVLVARAIA